jgi:hypothetical protein
MLNRDVSRALQEDQVVQTANALTQMTEAVTHETRVTTRRGPDGVVADDEGDDENEMDDPEVPVTLIFAADLRFQSLFNLETYRLTN